MKTLLNELRKTKQSLKSKAKKSGLYENFGQKEMRRIKDKYNYSDLVYGTTKERDMALMIDCLDDWCMDFDMSKINI